MVAAPAAADAVARARRMPALRVGLHLVLVEGRPLLPASSLSHLVDVNGEFRSDMAALGSVIAIQPRGTPPSLRRKSPRSSRRFAPPVSPLDHCNAHKHFHLHPVVGGLIAAIGARFGLRAARVPIEPSTCCEMWNARRGLGTAARSLCASSAPPLSRSRGCSCPIRSSDCIGPDR